MSGLVQRLIVEADTDDQLLHTLAILLVNRAARGYYAGTDTEGQYIDLHWNVAEGVTPFLAPIRASDELALQVKSWLKNCSWAGIQRPGGDGDAMKGWRIEKNMNGWSSAICTIRPIYIYYGK